MAHSSKQMKRLFLVIIATILFLPLFGHGLANGLFGNDQESANAAKKSDKFDVNKVLKAEVVYSKHVPILKVTVKPTVTNAFAKKDQVKFAFDKKNVNLKNMKASVQKHLPFKHATKKKTQLILTFTKDVKSGTYTQAYAIPTKDVSKVTKIKATYKGQTIKVKNNKIKSGKYAKAQADTASKKDRSDFKGSITTSGIHARSENQSTTSTPASSASSAANTSTVNDQSTVNVSQSQSNTTTYAETYYSNNESSNTTSSDQQYNAAATTGTTYASTTGYPGNGYGSTTTVTQTQSVSYGYGSGVGTTSGYRQTTTHRSSQKRDTSDYKRVKKTTNHKADSQKKRHDSKNAKKHKDSKNTNKSNKSKASSKKNADSKKSKDQSDKKKQNTDTNKNGDNQ
ncbi:hypothetical protein [Lentilactobacillus parafarraginis]|nr:hypothetical protein [Lentilactobacillus parafarraginis]